MPPETRTADLPTGVRLEYVEQGASSGTPVLLLHGLSDSWRSYEPVLAHLPESLHVFAVSQRGHGESSRPDDGYRFADFAADADAFMGAHDLDAGVVVGHSMGSVVAQRFAIDHPERTRGVVLAASFASMRRSPVPRALWESGVSTMEDPVDPDFVRDFQASSIAKPVSEPFFDAVVNESLKLPARVWTSVVGATLEDDFSDELDRIAAPTLLVWGDHDEVVDEADQNVLTDAIADSRLVTYEGVGHAVHWEEPRRFASDLTDFVQAVG